MRDVGEILIVEDSPTQAELLRNVLEERGMRVTIAREGQEALNILSSGKCRLVISDWVMPGMDGLELCRQIRASDIDGYIYIVLLTSRGEERDIVAGLSAGADDFITKPFDTDELYMRIHTGHRILSLETRDVAMFSMAKLAESRDKETGEHLERMRNYSRVLAQHLSNCTRFHDEINNEYVHLIYLTSPQHDIGKVGIPDSVLLKPGRLNDREFETMKTHTTIGAQTLEPAVRQYPGVEYVRLARDIALTHHERYDGSGYPAGLCRDHIPLCGRITALADVYDALTSKRVYKPAFPHDVARSMILDQAGKHFDPFVVEAFMENENQFIAMHERHVEEALI